ncbi:unnamed protein product [Amoebophrya sp. A120]|nr:unnamed protein product [Amoebophrya sp. A120]|eukprot:GSA120T00002186001.1
MEKLKSEDQLLDYIQTRQSEVDATKQTETTRHSEWTGSYGVGTRTSATSTGRNGTVTTLSSGKRPHLGLPLSQVERHDAISCHATGKRNCCAPDDLIRIYVKFPLSGDRLAFWVHRELMIGGALPANAQRNRFTEIFGEREEENAENKTDTAAEQDYLMQLMQQDSLKLRIQELTGIPVKDQKLWYNKIPITNPIASLRRAGIGHGSELMIRCKTRVARRSMNSVDGTRQQLVEDVGESIASSHAHRDKIGKGPEVGYRWYNQSGEHETRRKSLQVEAEKPYVDRISNTSDKSQARKSAESHKRDSYGSAAASDTASSVGGGAGGGSSAGGPAVETNRVITKDYDIDMNLLHKRVSQLPKSDAVFTNRSSVSNASSSRPSDRASRLGQSQYLGRNSSQYNRRSSATSSQRETTQGADDAGGGDTQSTFEHVVARMSEQDKNILRQQFQHDLLRIEHSSPTEQQSNNPCFGRGSLQEQTIYEEEDEPDFGLEALARISAPDNIPAMPGEQFYNHKSIPEEDEEEPAAPPAGIFERISSYFSRGGSNSNSNTPSAPSNAGPQQPPRRRNSTGSNHSGAPSSPTGLLVQQLPENEEFASVTPSSPSMLAYQEDDALSRYVRNSETNLHNRNSDMNVQMNRVSGNANGENKEGNNKPKLSARRSSAAQKLVLGNPNLPTSSTRNSTGFGGMSMSSNGAARRSSQLSGTKPFLIMPKMHFNPQPKLFEAPKIVYESPLYFDDFSLGDKRFHDGGHGDAFARVREKVLGIPMLDRAV